MKHHLSKSKIYKLYIDKNLSISEIAKKLNVSKSTIRNRIIKYNIPLRPMGTRLIHGFTSHPLYRKFTDMKTRCYNTNRKDYKNYGGRGIKICNEWLNNPKKFIEWAIKNNWNSSLQIDRIDNDGNYEPNNCRFIKFRTNLQNTRKQIKSKLPLGVERRDKKFRARIMINRKKIYLGTFDSPEEAHLAYINKCKEINE